ncbi:MAG: DUF2344 domain-containing protein [Tissierella sp.]|nr:DUF2344 domain-containing protein [Tissierella sp.]
MILRVKFNKKNYLKYIGHLDLLRLFQRTFNRAEIPVKYSEGFNPHPKFSIANPLSLGIESEEEYMDIDLVEKINTEDFIKRMNHILPKDIQILDAIYPDDEKSISAKLSWALYEIRFDIEKDLSLDEVKSILENWLNSGEIMISRLRKKGKRKVMKEEDIRPLIQMIQVKEKADNEVTIESVMRVGDGGNLRPFDFVDALGNNIELGMDVDSASLIRKALYIENGERLDKPI